LRLTLSGYLFLHFWIVFYSSKFIYYYSEVSCYVLDYGVC